MKNIPNKIIHITFIVILIFITIWLRLYKLDIMPGFSYEEGTNSIRITGLATADKYSRGIPRLEGVYFSITRFLFFIFGESLYLYRLSKVIINYAAVVLFFFLFKKIFSFDLKLFISIIFLISPYLIGLSRVQHNYNFMFLICIIINYFFIKFLISDNKLFLILTILIFIIAVLVHEMIIIILPGLILSYFYFKYKNLLDKIIFNKSVILPVFILFIIAGFIFNQYFSSIIMLVAGTSHYPKATGFYYPILEYYLYITLVLLIGLGILLFNKFKQKKVSISKTEIFIFISFISSFILYAYFFKRGFRISSRSSRYFIFIYFYLILSLSIVLHKLFSKKTLKYISIFLMIFYSVNYYFNYYYILAKTGGTVNGFRSRAYHFPFGQLDYFVNSEKQFTEQIADIYIKQLNKNENTILILDEGLYYQVSFMLYSKYGKSYYSNLFRLKNEFNISKNTFYTDIDTEKFDNVLLVLWSTNFIPDYNGYHKKYQEYYYSSLKKNNGDVVLKLYLFPIEIFYELQLQL